MPDFFEPHGSFPAEKIPPKTDEDKQYFQEWIEKAATIPPTVTKLAAYAKFLKQEGYQFVSVVGMCWGVVTFIVHIPYDDV
jgi:dienelactone hydrolase